MLTATQDLIKRFQNGKLSTPVTSAATEFIIKFGSVKDVDPLLDLFLQAPTDFDRSMLLDPIMAHGNRETADRIFHESFDQGKLKENMPESILHCLGYLEYEPALPVLMNYMRENDHYVSCEACLGLVHLCCKGYYHNFIPLGSF